MTSSHSEVGQIFAQNHVFLMQSWLMRLLRCISKMLQVQACTAWPPLPPTTRPFALSMLLAQPTPSVPRDWDNCKLTCGWMDLGGALLAGIWCSILCLPALFLSLDVVEGLESHPV